MIKLDEMLEKNIEELTIGVRICGEKYTIKLMQRPNNIRTTEYTEVAGASNSFLNEIEIYNIRSLAKKCQKIELHRYINETVRHEVMHAFLHETGINEQINEINYKMENAVEWFAVIAPKVFQVFDKLDVLY